MDFASQVGSKNPPKSLPSNVELIFWSIFDWFFVPTLTSRTFKSIVLPKEKQGYFKTSLFELHIDFGSFLVPTWLHFCTKKSAKIEFKMDPKRHSKFDGFSTPFFIDLGSILGPNLEPSWAILGTSWALRGHLGVILGLSWTAWDHLGPSWGPFWGHLGPS